MVDLVAFGIILDDLVFPDGRASMGVLGGGGPQTAFGMRLPALAGWTEKSEVGLVAGVGHDLPPSAREWLASVGIDQAGVRETELPTPRAWQLLETDGRRTQVWRVEGHVISAQLGRSRERIPESCRQARGFHLGIHPDEPDLDFIHTLGHLSLRKGGRPGGGPFISLEPFKPADRRPTHDALRQLCSAADIFSPNLAEARSLVGEGAPDELAHRLTDAGAHIVTLRMGQDGSLIHTRGGLIHVPAIATNVVDTTGAGNAYCGGFLAGYLHTGNVLTAARYATVAAAFLVEQVGLPPISDQLRDEANRRLRVLEQKETR